MGRIKNHNDIRALRSCKKLKEAYLKLVGYLDRNQINVTVVTDEAGLNRRTFYDHYTDIDKLLFDIEKDTVRGTVDHIASVTADKPDLSSSLKGLAEFLNKADYGHIRLFFAPEYSDFQMIYMDDVLSGSPFSDVINDTECPWIVKGYLSTFLPMYDQWRQGKITMSMDDFVECSAALFENGLNGVQPD